MDGTLPAGGTELGVGCRDMALGWMHGSRELPCACIWFPFTFFCGWGHCKRFVRLSDFTVTVGCCARPVFALPPHPRGAPNLISILTEVESRVTRRQELGCVGPPRGPHDTNEIDSELYL